MRENTAVARCNPSLGRDDLAGLRNDMRFGPDVPGIVGDRSREIDLGLDRPKAGSCRHQGVAGAASRAVDQGHGPAAMRRPYRIEEMIARLALECREPVADLDQPECQSLRDRRMRQAALD